MEWLNTNEASFYAACWILGFLSATFSLLGEPGNKSVAQCFYGGGVAGLLSFAVVSLFVGRIDSPVVGHWYYLGMATVIGMSAKQAELLRSRLFESLSRKVGYMFGDDNRGEPPKDS